MPYNVAMISIGITGSIGMGKSTVVGLLRDMGIPVHDSDETVHGLLASDPETISAIEDEFPDAVIRNLDGTQMVDRTILAKALGDEGAIRRLEAILHPRVYASAEQFKQDMLQAEHAVIAFDIPLLFETNGESRFDVSVCVSAPVAVQRARVMARPNMTAEKFEHILARQMPDAEKRRRADYVLENDGDIAHLRARIHTLLKQIQTPEG